MEEAKRRTIVLNTIVSLKRAGGYVYHNMYGKGIVESVEVSGVDDARIVVLFVDHSCGTVVSFDIDSFVDNISLTPYTGRSGFTPIDTYKPAKKNGDPFEVGDKVWFIVSRGIRGGVIVSNTKDEIFCIGVRSNECARESFTSSGQFIVGGDVVLFHQKPKIVFE